MSSKEINEENLPVHTRDGFEIVEWNVAHSFIESEEEDWTKTYYAVIKTSEKPPCYAIVRILDGEGNYVVQVDRENYEADVVMDDFPNKEDAVYWLLNADLELDDAKEGE